MFFNIYLLQNKKQMMLGRVEHEKKLPEKISACYIQTIIYTKKVHALPENWQHVTALVYNRGLEKE